MILVLQFREWNRFLDVTDHPSLNFNKIVFGRQTHAEFNFRAQFGLLEMTK